MLMLKPALPPTRQATRSNTTLIPNPQLGSPVAQASTVTPAGSLCLINSINICHAMYVRSCICVDVYLLLLLLPPTGQAARSNTTSTPNLRLGSTVSPVPPAIPAARSGRSRASSMRGVACLSLSIEVDYVSI